MNAQKLIRYSVQIKQFTIYQQSCGCKDFSRGN